MAASAAHAQADPVRRALRRVAGTAPGSWLFARVLHRIDRPVFRATRGRYTFASLAAGIPVVMLTTTGARTREPRTSPVLGFPTPDGLVVIASNFGQRHHPAWYHNLRADPRGHVTVDGRTRPFVAREVTGEERAHLWREGLEIYPGWAAYERRAGDRRIAVFVLDPA